MATDYLQQFISALKVPSFGAGSTGVSPFVASQKKTTAPMTPIPTGPMSRVTPASTSATSPAAPKVSTPAKTNAADDMNKKLGIGPYYPGGPAALNTAVKKEASDRNAYLSSLGDTSYSSFGGQDDSADFDYSGSGSGSGSASNPRLDAYTKAFEDYIASLTPSKELTDAQGLLGNIGNNIMKKGLDARRSYEAILGREGGTVQGARESAALDSRHYNSELADLAIQQDAAANTVTALGGNAKTLSEAQKARVDFAKSLLPDEEGFTLGKDQVRFDAQGNPVASGYSTDSGGGSYTAGADPTADAWVKLVNSGQAKLTDVPADYQSVVAQGLSTAPKGQSKGATDAISVIDQLLGKDTNAIAGIPGISAFIPGSGTQYTKNLAKQLSGMLSLENRQQLKGSGAISDFEFKVLAQAASALGIDAETGRSNLSNEDFKSALQKLKKDLSAEQGGITPDEEAYLRSRGYSDSDIQSLKQTGFNQVGGDTKKASKIVGGYDIGSYATDPNHEARVAAIYSRVKPVSTSTQADAYIRSVAPGSPVKGADVVAAAQAFGVSVPMILAIMQQDSTFGTKGLAVKTNNPGNVGNTDSGATRTYKTVRDGVFAVAKNLAGRKVA